MSLFGRWAHSEMQWYGNDHVREKTKARERMVLPVTVIIDIVLFILWYNF